MVKGKGNRVCKPCWAAYMRDWHKRNPDKAAVASRLYRKRHPNKARLSKRNYRERHREHNRTWGRLYMRRWRKLNAAKYLANRRRWLELYPAAASAHSALHYAIKQGRVVPQTCQVAGCAERGEAHHDDYSKPLDVRWLCASHHKRHHAEQRHMAQMAKEGAK